MAADLLGLPPQESDQLVDLDLVLKVGGGIVDIASIISIQSSSVIEVSMPSSS
jgi:hypothetical protein